MSLLVPPRRPSRERLDDSSLPSEEMARSLEDLRLVNRRWGGTRALERYLSSNLRAERSRRTILVDVGAGSADVSRRLSRALRRGGCHASVVAVDIQWRHLAAGRRMAAEEPLPAVCADAFHLPFAGGSVDWVVSNLLFHHFSPEQNSALLKAFAQLARCGFAFLDLRRHLLPLLFVSLAGRIVFKSRVSLEDGIVSVRQAYTREEALSIAQDAVPGSRVELVFPFRLLISSPSLPAHAARAATSPGPPVLARRSAQKKNGRAGARAAAAAERPTTADTR